ncbi:Type I Iterative PKS [Diaporthe australafricana]|uniref:Type I Iterative PKS n=1 Tax=Diaporthe australafricana TaxID=127596 RepID=A0ABR3XYX0_9PEZI
MGEQPAHDWASEPIAIIGLSCKFAGDASNAENLWKMLAEAKSAWSEIPESRFNSKGVYHPDPEKVGGVAVKGAYFLDLDPAVFDAGFFNFSAETASTLDPQFRLQLESVYEALENAGLTLESIAGSNTSAFAGAFFHDYWHSFTRDDQDLPRFLLTGNGAAMAANRISHFFDFRGASMTIDTGCSTTLVALHQAVQSLRTGEAEMSVVGGSNLMLTPDNFKGLGSLGFLSADGKSYAFDSRANGYARGEGVATIVLKRLKDAVAAGDPIRAVVRQTCLNQDGKTETITSPSQAAQEALIRECYQRAGLDPRDTQYFEAHGTGTKTGDPIEARAVAAVFQPGRCEEQPLRIGSVKTNLGHTEPTSGLASIIKVVLALERGIIPPTINFEQPNEKLHLDEWHMKVATSLEPWPTPNNGGPRRASVNSFGYGGSNAHVIVEAWGQQEPVIHRSQHGLLYPQDPESLSAQTDESEMPRYKSKVLVISAKDEQACQRMITNLADHLRHVKPVDEQMYLQSLAYTLGQRRTTFPWAAAAPVPYTRGLPAVVQALESPRFKPARSPRRSRVGMVFTGQGAQWHAMGRELILAYPVYKASLLEIEKTLTGLGAEWSLTEELSRDAECSRVNEVAISIPVCVALQISLVRLLRSWGVVPVAVSSHSSGEIAAAWTVGALSLQGAMAAAYYRAVLAADEKLRGPAPGAMVAVGLGADDAEQYVARVTGGKAVVACINSPSSVTVAGDAAAMDEIESFAASDGVFARRLKVATAYHSHHMDPIADIYFERLSSLQETDISTAEDDADDDDDLAISFSSSVTGARVSKASELADPAHWVASLVQPVQFVDGLTDMILGDMDPSGTSVDVIVEVGPHAALGGPIRQILDLPEFGTASQVPYFSCLNRKETALGSMQSLAASLIQQGLVLDMTAVNFPWGQPPEVGVLHDLPSYSWSHQARHWAEPRMSKAHRQRRREPHDLLGIMVPGSKPQAPSWRRVLRPSETPWIRDHVVQSNYVFPGAGFVSLVIEAMSLYDEDRKLDHGSDNTKTGGISGYRLRDVEIQQALVIPDTASGIEIQTTLRPVDEKSVGTLGWMVFEICSVSADNGWTDHAKGLIVAEVDGSGGDAVVSDQHTAKMHKLEHTTGLARRIDPEDLWESFRSGGIVHGPVFQNISRILQVGGSGSVCDLSVPDYRVHKDLPRNTLLHPTTLDSIFVTAYTALPGLDAGQESPRVPRSIRTLWVSAGISHEPGHRLRGYSTLSHHDARSVEAEITVTDDTGADGAAPPLLQISGLICQSLGASVVENPAGAYRREVCNKLAWAADSSLETTESLATLRDQLALMEDPDEYGLILDLRRVCLYFITDALEQLSESDTVNLQSHHSKFYQWMRQQVALAESGQLAPGSAAWLPVDMATREHHIHSVAKASVNGELLCHVGPHLTSILRQERSPLELMMEDKILYRYYTSALKAPRSFGLVGKLLRHVAHKNPRARILEIGAGTGGATRHTLRELGTDETGGTMAESYHFTDISSGFFESAKNEFADWANVLDFDRLDIEQDPAAQGFELGSYDVVVACQVLHATQSMARTMANVRRLLKPGGTLLLFETIKDQLDLQFLFGLLPGWWLSEEPERQSSPSLSSAMWDQVLRGAGFTGIDLEMRDGGNEETYSYSVIMSRLPPLPTTVKDEVVVVVPEAPEKPPSAWLASLQQSIAAVSGGTTPSIQPLLQPATTWSNKIAVLLTEVSQPLLHDLDNEALGAVKALATNCKGLLWVTRGGAVECQRPELGLAPGFLRSLRNEYVGRRYSTLDLDPDAPIWSGASPAVIARVLHASFGTEDSHQLLLGSSEAPPPDFEFAERGGAIMVPRFFKDLARNKIASPEPADHSAPGSIPMAPIHQPGRTLTLQVGIPGLLDTLAFGESPAGAALLLPHEVEIRPVAYGVNFRDVMVAMGQLNERVMGLELAGTVTRVGDEAASQGFATGDRVFCLLPGPYASAVRVDWRGVVHMPAALAFEEAASMLCVFATAHYCLSVLGRLQRGESVLIHAAAGGVGQAAIMAAKHMGAEVYATVGTPEKRETIVREYGIPRNRVFSSRDASFSAGVLAATEGRGVDVVLNSLAGTLLQRSFDVLAPYGRFVEIGKRDLEGNSSLEMKPFSRQATFSSFDLLAMLHTRMDLIHRILKDVAGLISAGAIKPVHPVTSYSITNMAQAFRLLQTGKHTGKVVLTMGDRDEVPVVPRAPAAEFKADASYLLVGGIGGIGRSVANWMVSRGARNIVLLSRSAGRSEKTAAFISELQDTGCRVKAISCDVTVAGDLSSAIGACDKELPPIRGVIQAAMVLQDSILEQMSIEDWNAAVRPKVQGSWNLHKQFLDAQLDFFVMLSSAAGIVGYPSQSNYSAGGSFEDALAHWRVGRGLPAVSIDLGAVKGVGYVAETSGVAKRMADIGHMLMSEAQVLGAIESAILAPYEPQLPTGFDVGPGPQWDRDGKSQLGRDARFLALRWRRSGGSDGRGGGGSAGAGGGGAAAGSLANELAEAASVREAEALVGSAIVGKLAEIFMLPVDEIDPSRHPSTYGIDSLVAVELRNMLALQAAAEVSIFSIMQSSSLAALASEVTSKSGHIDVSVLAA